MRPTHVKTRTRVRALGAGAALVFAMSFAAPALGQSGTSAPTVATTGDPAGGATRAEVDALRDEVRALREQLDEMRTLLRASTKSEVAGTAPPASASPIATAEPASQTAAPRQDSGAPQSTAAPADSRIAISPKSAGGDLSGAGNLLRTDRLTIGGYGDFQFREAGIEEKGEGGATSTFSNPRLVLGIAAVLSERQNIVFNSEIEYEFGGAEVEVEQAYVEWRARPEFAFRGGIFTPSIGRFNVYHDSNVNLTAIRPLINQFIVPTAYSDTGIGVRGRFALPAGMKLSYEADVVNGLGGDVFVPGEADDAEKRLRRLAKRDEAEEEHEGEESEAATFSRLSGQAEAGGGLAFQDVNGNKAFVGRLALSPVRGLEFGGSFYTGRTSPTGQPERTLRMLFFDGSFSRGGLTINGEYARSTHRGAGIEEASSVVTFDPADEESLEELAEFLNAPSPGQDGFYVEGSYRFAPKIFHEHFDDGAYIAPVVRFEGLRMDRTLDNFYLNRVRTTVGLNFAPSPSVIFKANYLFNTNAADVPDFDEGDLVLVPFPNFGKSGFTGSIAYVF
jgi:hypothetical protein